MGCTETAVKTSAVIVQICHNVNGTFLKGCEAGYTNTLCKQRRSMLRNDFSLSFQKLNKKSRFHAIIIILVHM